jgi:hypothetical protein
LWNNCYTTASTKNKFYRQVSRTIKTVDCCHSNLRHVKGVEHIYLSTWVHPIICYWFMFLNLYFFFGKCLSFCPISWPCHVCGVVVVVVSIFIFFWEVFCRSSFIIFSYFLTLSCLWSYGSWIYNYLYNQFLSRLKLWARIPLMVRCTRYSIMW